MLFGLVALSVMALAASPVTKGKLSISGNGCTGGSALTPVSGQSDRYELPIKIKFDKKESGPFVRTTCNMRLPVALKKDQKLQISDISQKVQMDGNGAKASLTISVAGKKGKLLIADISTTLKADGIVAESDCGRDTIVTGDVNLFSSQPLKAETFPVQVTMKVVDCN